MVKILASGEIVPDDDPRVAGGGGGASNRPGSAMPRHRQGGINQVNDQEPVQHMPDGSIFEDLNQRLLALGVPRWNVGSYVVEPIVSVGFLAAFLLVGFRGLLFAAILFLISQVGIGGGGPGQGFRGWLGGGSQRGQQDESSGHGRGGGNQQPPRGGGGGGGSGGYRLGRS